MAERQELIRLAVFGKPVTASLSPLIHQQFAKRCGLAVEYLAIECGPDEFATRVRQLAESGGRGCNITVPLKHLAWQQSHRKSPGAERARAVNTLVFEQADNWFGDTTDGRGLVQDLTRRLSNPLTGSRILIMGAGGATAGILGDLLNQNPAAIVIANRSPDRAAALVTRFDSPGKLGSCGLDQLDDETPFDLLINATSLGHRGQHPAFARTLIKTGGLVYDLNYANAAQALQTHCTNIGIDYQDGLGMLVEQAAISFQLWTGVLPDSETVLNQLRSQTQNSN